MEESRARKVGRGKRKDTTRGGGRVGRRKPVKWRNFKGRKGERKGEGK